MAATFCKAVANFRESTLSLEKKRENERKLYTWSYVAKKIVSLLQNYPTGLTEAVILTELLSSQTGNHRQATENEVEQLISISTILETKQVDLGSFVECFINTSDSDISERAGVVTLVDKRYDSERKIHSEKIPSIEMYLHQKASCMEQMFNKYPFRMTQLRIHKLETRRIYRLLPTEYLMPVLDATKDEDFIKSKFGTLEGIFDEDPFPHYTRHVLVKITKINQTETLHNPYGDSIKKSVIGLTDSNGININFVLWDETIAFKRLISLGDSLGIEDPFLLREDENSHIEYGPATILFCIPAVLETEVIPSQAEYQGKACVEKTIDGKLDFSLYPNQFMSTDAFKNSINITLVGTIRKVSEKDLFQLDGMKGHHFMVDVYDQFSVLHVEVFDNEMNLHELVYIGQMVLLENMEIDDYSNCILEVSKGGKMSVISGLKGYVASPCLYSLTNNLHEKGDGNHFLLGKISGTAGKDCGYIKKSHCSCLGTVAENKAGQLYCLTCKSSELLKLDSKGHAETKDIGKFWKWRYNIMISVAPNNSEYSTDFEVTEQVCEELIGLVVDEFANKDDSMKSTILNEWIGRLCVFSVTQTGDLKRIDAFEVATEGFLENFKSP